MNEESQAQHCGDTCSVVASMAAVFSQYVPVEVRMAQAIAAVQSGTMSQRAAAAKFEVARRTLGDHLAKVGESAHPAKPVAAEGESGDLRRSPAITSAATKDKNQRQTAIRKLARANGLKELNGKPLRSLGAVAIHDALAAMGVAVPEEVLPPSLLNKAKASTAPAKTTTEASDQPQTPGIQPSDQDEDDDPLLADRIDIKQLNARVLRDVLNSNRPQSFKRAVELLTELEEIAVRGWYGENGWSEQDWVHVNSQVKTIQSLTGQRAEEAHSAFLERVRLKKGAITI